MGKLLKIKFRWEPKLILGVREFLPKSWNSLSSSHEEFPSTFCHTCSTSDWLLLCIFFSSSSWSLWVSESVSGWAAVYSVDTEPRERCGVFLHIMCLFDWFFLVFLIHFIFWLYFILRTLHLCLHPCQTAGNVNFSWRCMKYLSNQILWRPLLLFA